MRSTPTSRRLLGALAVVAVLTGAAGCGGADSGETTDTATVTSTAPTSTTVTTAIDTDTSGASTVTVADPATVPTLTGPDVTVYRMNDAATGLVAATVPGGDGPPLRSALVALAQTQSLPVETKIVGTDVRGDAAYVNLSPEFLDGYPSGGAAAELAVLAPLVYTATEAASVERVRITVDGQTPAPVGSQFDWSRGFSRSDFPDLTISGG